MTTDNGPVLVDTDEAARTLQIPSPQLERWAQSGVVTPTATDPEGGRWWNVSDLRQQIATRIEDREL